MGIVSRKVALVTDAWAGIGRHTALTFAAEGAKVAVSDIDVAGGEETVFMIIAKGGDAHFVQADVSKSANVSDLIAQTVAKYGRP